MPKTRSGNFVLDAEVLEAALAGLEAQRQRLDEHIAEVRSLLGSPRRGRPRAADTGEAPSVAVVPRKRRRMSAAGRKRIAEAQKKRWAELRKPKEPAAKASTPSDHTKRHMSAAGRRRIAEATKRRWAEFRKKQAAKQK